MQTSPEVIIVGGGVIGCGIAYELARRKVRVQLLEQRQLGSGATHASAGMLAPLSDSMCDPALIDLGFSSFAIYKPFLEEAEEIARLSAECMPSGILRVAKSEEEERHLRALADFGNERGLRVEWVTAKQAQSLEPLLSPAIRGAAYSPGEPQLSPSRLIEVLRRAAIARGATVREETPVTGLVKRGAKVTGVRTPQETLSAEIVVLATGAWGRAASQWLGYDVPVAPVRGQVVYVNRLARPLSHTVLHAEAYAVPKGDGLSLIGTTLEHDAGYEQQVTAAGMAKMLTNIQALLPSVGATTVNHSRAGLRPRNIADDLPILGRAPGNDAVVLALGHYRSGILLTPITARMIADVVTTGKTKGGLGKFSAARLARA
jgi:glycine oxidase